MLSPQKGMEYTFHGKWEHHPKYGRGFMFSEYEASYPTELTAVRAYLKENCKHIGPEISKKLIKTFGKATLQICKEEPARVAEEIPGLTPERAKKVSVMLKNNEADEQLQLRLKEIVAGTRISRRAVNRIIALYGREAPEKIKKDPYQLIEDIDGVGFLTADELALKVGYEKEGRSRITAGIVHVLKESAFREGHTCLPVTMLMVKAKGILQVDGEKTGHVLNSMIEGERLVAHNGYIYLPALYEQEQQVAGKLRALVSIRAENGTPCLEDLHEDQADAMHKAVGCNAFILTGPPGTGKTFTIRRIIQSFPKARIKLAAPTGKGAKRMYEESGMRAQTIHKLLEPQKDWKGFYFTRDAENPLDADIIILDEVSMIDTSLMASFLDAVKPETRLIMVGDTYQLPSVGPGNILKDMISSGIIPCTELSIIKRQDEGHIIRNCHAIKNGRDIELSNSESDDFFFLRRNKEDDIRNTVLDLITNRLKQSYNANPLKDIQIISPLRERTSLSCKAFNRECQQKLNRNKPIEKCKFKKGDKVIQTRNQYELDIINGDIGFVRSVNTREQSIFVDFENPPRLVELPLYRNHLELAYAITCVAADTWIWTEKGMHRISDISLNLDVGKMREHEGSVGTHAGMRPVRRVMHIGEEPTIRIRTRTGLTLEMSRRHRVMTVDRITGKEKWTYASDLDVGIRLPIPRGGRLGATCKVSTGEFSPAQHPNGCRNKACWPSQVDEGLAELLGALVADGNYTDRKDARVEVGKADPWRSRIRKQIESLFGIQCRDRFERQRNVGNFYFHNKTVREFLLWCGLEYVIAPDKSVPRVILASPVHVQAAFLRGLFSGDGSVTSHIVLATSSGLLAEQVQLLLLNLGIVPKRYLMRAPTSRWEGAWRIEISGGDIDLFNRYVGFSEAYKHNDAMFLREDIPYKKTNWDTIPGGAQAARELRDALRNRDGRRYRASTQAKILLSRLARGDTRLAYHHIDFLMQEIEDFESLGLVYEKWRRWYSNHWFYDKIVEVSKGHADLYDLTVSDPHAYMSNSIISHNCHKFQGSEARIIIIPIHRSFGPLIMQRNWLYTAVSRAKEVCILVGQRNEIPRIIKRNRQQERFTSLARFLCEKKG